MMNEKSTKKNKNIATTMFWYWIGILIWQTVRPVANRSLLDTGVKIGFFLLVVIYAYSNRSKKFSFNFVSLFLLFITSQFVTMAFDVKSMGLGHIITVAFMMMQIFIFFGWSHRAEIKIDHLTWFCRQMLVVGAIMSIYNIIFNWTKFSRVLSLSGGAYGSECKSFLYSNHEFALYLAATIIALTWLQIKKEIKPTWAVLLYLLYGINMMSTYSRTAMLGCIGAVLILLFFYNKKAFFIVTIIGAIAILIINSNSYLYSLVFEKIFKGSFTEDQVLDEGRSSMYEEEFNAFMDAGFFQKIFGHGYGGGRRFPGHDAYLKILLIGGIVMFGWFAFVILTGIHFSLVCLKYDKSVGSLMLGFQTLSLLYMVAQTPILFYSTMDSFFVTMISILFPMYIANSYRNSEIIPKGNDDENFTAQLRL